MGDRQTVLRSGGRLECQTKGTEEKVGSSTIHPAEFAGCLKRENSLNLRTSK